MFSSRSSSLCFLVSVGLTAGSGGFFRSITLEKDSGFSQTVPVYDLPLSQAIASPFDSREYKDAEYLYQPFSNEPMMVPIDITDRILMARIQRSDIKINSSATIYGVLQDDTARKSVVSLPFNKALPLSQGKIIDYEELYADASPSPVATAAVFNTPPASPEQARKRARLPDTPALFVDPVTRRCRAALRAFRRNVPQSTVELTSLQNQLNGVLIELELMGLSVLEFNAFDQDFDGQFMTLVDRCPEDFLIPAMLYSLMTDEQFPKFSLLYERQVDYWQAHSSRFSSQLLRGIFLLPQTSSVALSFFQTMKNPHFFFNHESQFNFLIGCFHFEEVVQAMAFASRIAEAGQNSIAAWLNQEARTFQLTASAPDSHFKGLLMLLHRIRVLFDDDSEHLNYIKQFFEIGIEKFSNKPIQRSAFLSAFAQSKMSLILLERALLSNDRNFIALLLSFYEIKGCCFLSCPQTRQATVVLENNQFFVEIFDSQSSLPKFRYRII